MRYKLFIEYYGAAFCGWQKQPKEVTVQGIIENAISVYTKSKPRVIGSGRTDSGVHAIEQVAHFDFDQKLNCDQLKKCINNNVQNLPVIVLNIQQVDQSFNSITSAKARTYLYKIINRRENLTFNKHLYHHESAHLNTDAMLAASKYFIGSHDFSSFRSSGCQSKNPVKTIYDIRITGNYNEIELYVTGNAFLQHQVRNMVGALIYVGTGKWSIEYLDYILKARDRKLSAPTAPAHGLYLYKIDY